MLDVEVDEERQATASRHASAEASRKPEAMPWPPTCRADPTLAWARYDSQIMVLNSSLTWWKDMSGITAENDTSKSPLVAASGIEVERSAAEDVDAIFWIPNLFLQPRAPFNQPEQQAKQCHGC